jgi:2-haloacid dehalogenase
MSQSAGRIKAVVFDVGKVLVHWDLRCLFAKLIDDQTELDWFLTNVVTQEWHFVHDAGGDLDARVASRKLLFPGYAELIDAYATRFVETIPGPVQGTHELVEQLSRRGVPLYAITNFGAKLWDQFRPTEPLLNHFRGIVVSGVERLIKPDPRIFELAASRFGHTPQEMLFIDDDQANIASAERLGWQIHHFTDADRLAEDLRSRCLIS